MNDHVAKRPGHLALTFYGKLIIRLWVDGLKDHIGIFAVNDQALDFVDHFIGFAAQVSKGQIFDQIIERNFLFTHRFIVKHSLFPYGQENGTIYKVAPRVRALEVEPVAIHTGK